MHAPFDQEWFAGILALQDGSGSAPSSAAMRMEPAERAQDWGEAPDTTGFVGRAEELVQLQRWVLDERGRLVAVLGMGGIGKTSLAARLAQTVAPNFERVYWRNVRNAPPVSEWLAGAIVFLSDQQVVPPRSESEAINGLLQLLRARRCMLVLDNSETLFEPGQREGRYRAGLDGYGRVLQAIGETSHRSCLLLTSREAPPELTLLRGAHALELQGLGVTEAEALLADKQLHGDAATWSALVDRYGGNGLALKIVGETIRQVYGGDVGVFLAEMFAGQGAVFGGIRRLLDVQVERLSAIEQHLMTRLAIEREPVGLAQLAADMAPHAGRSVVIEAVENLRRRSLVERGEQGATFTLQSMVLEHATDRLVETIADEITRGEPALLVEQPLIKAQAKDYVRQTQERLIGAPIIQRLNGAAQADSLLLALLEGWRGRPLSEHGFGPGNVGNLLRVLRGNLRAADLSRLVMRQVYLQGVDAQDATLAGARLIESVFTEAFVYATAIALSADGAFLAAGAPSGEVRVWGTSDRTLVGVAQGHADMVVGLAFSEDGRFLTSCDRGGGLRLWATDTCELRATMAGHADVVWSAALSANGDRVASGSYDGTVRLWDGRRGELLETLRGHTGRVWGVALSGDGRVVASGGDDGTVRLWDAGTASLRATLEGRHGGFRGVALTSDGHLVAAGSQDGTVRVWETASGEPMATLNGHSGVVPRVAFSRDGRLVASGGYDGTVRLWEPMSGQLVATLPAHAGGVFYVAISGDGQLVASCGWDGTVRLWDPGRGQQVVSLQGDNALVRGVALSRDGQVVAGAGTDGMVRLWNVRTGQLTSTISGHTGAAWCVALSSDGHLVASGGFDGTIQLWKSGQGKPLASAPLHAGTIWGVALSGDGQLAASGGLDGSVRVWEVQTGRLVATFDGHVGMVYSVALSDDGELACSGGVDGTVRLWDTATGRPVATLQSKGEVVFGVALSPAGGLAASGGVDGTVRLWDTQMAKQLADLEGHHGAVHCVALSADGRLAASGGQDRTVRIWATPSGEPVACLQGHTAQVRGVGLSGDGRLVASSGDDGLIKLWDVERGTTVRTLRSDRPYERLNITGLSGVTEPQRAALIALGTIDHAASTEADAS
jgi:WD40 repeat protein